MLNEKIADLLNQQVEIEANASMNYLAFASWMENNGFVGTAKFLYVQSDEERMHMIKIFHYINDAGGESISPGTQKPQIMPKNYKTCFELILDNERAVTKAIHNLIDACVKLKDHTTYNFLQWYVKEQLEEETTFKEIIDKLKIVGTDGSGLYMLDRDMEQLATANSASLMAENANPMG